MNLQRAEGCSLRSLNTGCKPTRDELRI